MSPVDPYSMTDRLDDTSIQVVVNRLEARGKQPVFAKMLADYLDAMLIDTAETVLDLGCGTGMVARAIARRRGFSGKVTGRPSSGDRPPKSRSRKATIQD